MSNGLIAIAAAGEHGAERGGGEKGRRGEGEREKRGELKVEANEGKRQSKIQREMGGDLGI
jgi:hypothetical protein